MSDDLQGSNTFLTADEIRDTLRDNDPASNLLLEDLEFSPREIDRAMTKAVDYFNELPPGGISFGYAAFPYRYNLTIGACAQLLRMAAHRYRRNKQDFRIPGGGVSDQARDRDYDQAADRLWGEYRGWCRTKKHELNLEQGWGSV